MPCVLTKVTSVKQFMLHCKQFMLRGSYLMVPGLLTRLGAGVPDSPSHPGLGAGTIRHFRDGARPSRLHCAVGHGWNAGRLHRPGAQHGCLGCISSRRSRSPGMVARQPTEISVGQP